MTRQVHSSTLDGSTDRPFEEMVLELVQVTDLDVAEAAAELQLAVVLDLVLQLLKLNAHKTIRLIGPWWWCCGQSSRQRSLRTQV